MCSACVRVCAVAQMTQNLLHELTPARAHAHAHAYAHARARAHACTCRLMALLFRYRHVAQVARLWDGISAMTSTRAAKYGVCASDTLAHRGSPSRELSQPQH